MADEVEAVGIGDWAPGPEHPDHQRAQEEWLAERHEEPSEAEDLDAITARLKSGVKPTYGDGYELAQREVVRERLDKLKLALVQIRPARGGLGHNRPPPDDESPQAIVIDEIRDAEGVISKELTKAEPDAVQVATATMHLQAALGWLGKKIDIGAESFAKSFGATAGAAAAMGLSAVGGSLALHPLIHLVSEIVHHVAQWLSYVTQVF